MPPRRSLAAQLRMALDYFFQSIGSFYAGGPNKF